MLNYIIKRLFLIIPTLFGILAVNFIIIQAAPGGPVEKAIAQIKGTEVSVTERFTSSGGEQVSSSQTRNNFSSGWRVPADTPTGWKMSYQSVSK